MTAAGRDLAAAYLPLALAVAGPVARKFPGHAEEIRTAALLGLIEAAATHDSARSRFPSRCRRLVRYRVLDALRSLRRRAAASARVRPSGPATAALVGGREAHDDDPSGPAEEEDWFRWATRDLRAAERRVVEMVYRRGMTQQEAADEMGITKSRVSAVHAEALARVAGRVAGTGGMR